MDVGKQLLVPDLTSLVFIPAAPCRIFWEYLVKKLSYILRRTAGKVEYFSLKYFAVTCMVLSLYIRKPPNNHQEEKRILTTENNQSVRHA